MMTDPFPDGIPHDLDHPDWQVLRDWLLDQGDLRADKFALWISGEFSGDYSPVVYEYHDCQEEDFELISTEPYRVWCEICGKCFP